MSTSVFVIVLIAALLHATWNALVKSGQDKFLSMGAVVLGHTPFALAILLISPAPAPVSWPWIFTGAVLHFGYQVFLLKSYRIGDLSQVYPIARGSAPLLVVLVSTTFLGEVLRPGQLAGILLIAVGLICMASLRTPQGLMNSRAAFLAFIAGLFIAAYSLVDGWGARQAGTALGFYAWLSLINAVFFPIFAAVQRPGLLAKMNAHAKIPFFVGGGASFAAYSLVIWAFTQAPISLVTGLRETSIIFALLISVVFLGESFTRTKLVATLLTLAGAILLKLSAG